MSTVIKYPNGIASWNDSFFEIATYMALKAKDAAWNQEPTNVIEEYLYSQGSRSLQPIAEQWATEFEEKNVGRFWDGEFIEEMDEFLENKNKLDD